MGVEDSTDSKLGVGVAGGERGMSASGVERRAKADERK